MKRITPILSAILVCLLFASCSSGNDTPKTVDINSLSTEIIKNIEFVDDLVQVDLGIVKKLLYPVADGTEFCVYTGSGATAEEFSIFSSANKTDSSAVLKIAKTHIEEQKNSFKDYIPEEMDKLNNAYIVQKGNYVVVCVTDDLDSAKKIIDKYFA